MVPFDAEGAVRLFKQLNRCLFCCSTLPRSVRKQKCFSVTEFNEVWNHLAPQEEIEFLETPPVCSNCGETLEKLYTALVQLTETTLEIRKTITESGRNGKYSKERFSKLLEDLRGDGVDDKCRRGALSLLKRLGHEEVFEEDYQSWFLKENIVKVEGNDTISTDGHGDGDAGQSDAEYLPDPEKEEMSDTFSSKGDSDDDNDRESDSDYSPDDDLPVLVMSPGKEKSRQENFGSGRRPRSKRLTEQSKTKIKDDDEEGFSEAGADRSSDIERDFEPEGSRPQKKTRWSSIARSYACGMCHEKIPLEDLGEHVRSHVGDYALPCPNPECKRVFLTLPELNYHMGWMNKCKCFLVKSIYSCSSCDFQGSNNKTLFKHLLAHHHNTEKVFTCPVANCSESYSTRQTVQCHLSRHAPLAHRSLKELTRRSLQNRGGEDGTDRSSDNESDLEPEGSGRQKKSRRLSMARSYACAMCHKNIRLENLGEHVRSHVGDYALPCPNPDCKRVFLTLPQLNYHVGKNNCKSFVVKSLYSCSSCDFWGSNNKTLFKHLLSSHKSEKPSFSCPVANCSESFSTRQAVQCHISQHAPVSHRNEYAPENTSPRRTKLLPRLKSISCDFCMEPVSPDSLEDHVRSHVGDYALPCQNPNCKRIFATIPHWTMHLSKKACIKHRLPNILTCELCEFRAHNTQNLTNHFNSNHNADEKKFSCPVTNCPESFPCRQAVQCHIREHALASRPSFQKCSDCGKELPQDEMRSHLETVHELKPETVISCSQCPFLCSSWESLLNHFNVHFGVNVALPCPLCGEEGYAQVFRRLSILRDHFWERHKIGTPRICDLCPFTCWSATGLVKHAANHHGPPNLQKEPKRKFKARLPIKCSLCPKTYKFTSDLVGHKIREHGAPKMECDLCGEKFTYPHLFNRHKRNHAGIKRTYRVPERNRKPKELPQGHKSLLHGGKQVECNLCGRTLSATTELKKHQLTKLCRNRALGMLSNRTIQKYERLSIEGPEGRTFTAPRLFCEKCGKEFSGKCALKAHLAKVHSEETFQCEICGRKFKCWGSFRDHKARKGVRCVSTALHAKTQVEATSYPSNRNGQL